MASPADVLNLAYSVGPTILRDWPGYDAPVPSVWCADPCDRLGLCGTTGQQHCAGTVAKLYAMAGLEAGRDFPWPFVYCPAIHAATEWHITEPEPGGWVLLDWEMDGIEDHCELIIGAPNWPASISTAGANTDPSGIINYFERPAALIASMGRPRWHTTSAAPAAQPRSAARLRRVAALLATSRG